MLLIMFSYCLKYCRFVTGKVSGMNKKKLLIVGAFPPAHKKIYGGVVTACKALIASTLSQEFNILTVDTTQASNPPPHIFIRFSFAVNRFVQFVKTILLNQPDCLLIFTSSGVGLVEKGLMGRFGRWLDIPVLLFPRGGRVLQTFDNSFATRVIAHFSYSKPSKILCQGGVWQAFLHQKIGRNLIDLPIVPNWAATTDLLKIGSRRQYHTKRTINLLYVGWVEKEKGILELLEAFSVLPNKYNISLRIVGNGRFQTRAERFVKENSMTDSVVLTGWLQNEPLLKAYEEADVFVFPSWMEGLPNSMIEAMAAGLPVVVTQVGNIPSVIKNNENGLLVPSRSPRQLAKSIERVCSDCNLRSKLGSSAHIYAKDNFSIENAISKLRDAIYSVERV